MISRGRHPMLAIFASLSVVTAHGAVLELTVQDDDAPLPCRILVRGADGRCVAPPGAVTLQTAREMWFMSPGACRVEVPPGATTVRIEGGLEFTRIAEQFEVDSAGASKRFRLKRWINMRQRGYLCGENHLHVDTVQLAPMLAAEGLDFGTSLSWWRGPDPRRSPPEGNGAIRLLSFAGHEAPTSVYDAELEYNWGAAYIQNLPAPLPLEARRDRPNLDYLRHAVEAGAIVHYQGGWSREVLVDALAGFVHTINICNNNFALHRFQPRSRYSNLLDVDDFPVYPDTDVGMMRMNTDTYYRLLNCGLQLAAGAGSATGVKFAPVGYNRAYVRVPAGASLPDFYETWQQGRNFVTNGPILLLRTEENDQPGDTIELPSDGGQVRLHVEGFADQALTAVEIVANGKVVASFDPKNQTRFSGSANLDVRQGTWIAARCTARDDWVADEELADYQERRSDGSILATGCNLRFAHTSPIYLNVGRRGAAVKSSLREGLRMISQFEEFARKEADVQFLPSLMTAIQNGRAQLDELLARTAAAN